MEKLIKGVKKEEEKKKGIDFNKPAIRNALIGIGIIAGLGAAVYFFGGEKTEVKVSTGVGTKQVEEVVKPIYQQIEETKRQQEELKGQVQALNETLKNLNETLKSMRSGEWKVDSGEVRMESRKEEETANLLTQMIKQNRIKKGEKLELPPPAIKPTMHHKQIVQVKVEKPQLKMFERQIKKKEKKPTVYIPAGSIVEGKLMYSFTAPEKGVLPPVLIELERSVRAPNDFFIPLQKCLIVTQARFDVSQEVALLGGRGSKLSCTLRNGKVVEIPVNVAVGEEIKGQEVIMGLKGKVKYLTKKDLAEFMSVYSVSGFSEGMRESLVQQNTTVSGAVTTAIKDRGLYSILSGVNAGVQKFAEYWLRKYENKYPAIKVSNNKRIFVLFIDGADLKVEDKEL